MSLTATPSWDNVPQWDTETPLLGGPADAPLNRQAQALLNRTELLKSRTDSMALPFATHLEAVNALPGLIEGQSVEIDADETRSGLSTLNVVQDGALVFVRYVDQLRIDLTQPSGNEPAGGFAAYANLDAYTGPAKRIIVLVDGQAWYRTEASKAPNGGTIRADGLGRIWEREDQRIVTPEMFGAVGNNPAADTNGILKALAAHKELSFGDKKYCMTVPFITDGHTVHAVVGETFSGTGTIIEFDFAETPAIPFAVRNINHKSVVENIRFIQKTWSVPVNGLRIDRITDYNNCDFSYFNGHGSVLESNDSAAPVPPATVPRSCYSSTLRNVTCDYNAKNGWYIGGGANDVLIINPRARWNGAPSYGVAPSVAGDYDGIFTDGSSAFPGNGLTGEPQGTTIINPEAAYNSRYGLNLQRFFDGTILGGYGEVNLVGDIRLANVFGTVVNNFMPQQPPVFAIPDSDPLEPSRNLSTYPPRIIMRGVDYGFGHPSAATPLIFLRDFIAQKTMRGSDGGLEMGPAPAGGVRVQKSGGDTITFDFTNVQVVAQRFNLGTGAAGSSATNNFSVAGNAEGTPFFNLLTGSQWGSISVANGGGANTAQAFMIAPKHSTNGRSINAGGTVNAAGADYAEYEENNGLKFQKGEIVGFKSDGTLTDKFSESIRFGIKSTNPSIVGGDTWFTDVPPVFTPETADAPTDQEIEAHAAAVTAFHERMELARAGVDRIAYCGKVPCNFSGGIPGDFLIPVAGVDDCIEAIAVAQPTLQQLYQSIGRISKTLPGSKVEIVVK